jgi:chromosome segregation ATPase
MSTVFDELKTLNRTIQGLNSEDQEKIAKIKKDYQNYAHKDIVPILTQQNSSIEEFSKKMKNLLIKSSVQINVVFTNYHTIKKSLLEIMEKVEKYSDSLNSLEKDFAYLLNPSYFPQAYQASVIEIKRRLIFNKKISKDLERIRQLVSKENMNRKLFIQDYGKYLTHDYVPQLKFSDLKLSIDFQNNEENSNLPNILEEEEENTLNSGNIYLDYDEYVNQSNGDLVERKSQNILSNVSARKNSEDNCKDDTIRSLNAKISELEIVTGIKEAEIKKLMSKLEQRERKITQVQSEVEKLSNNFEALTENLMKQIAYKDTKYKEKVVECENLLKNLNAQNENRLQTCPMCKDIASNSIDYQGWGNFVKDYHEKLHEKNKVLSKIESRFQELVAQTLFVKKTFFNHLHSSLETKNLEIMTLKQSYENKLMHLEDLLSQEKSKFEKELKSVTSQSNSILENKIKELNKINFNLESECKSMRKGREELKKSLEEYKVKESSLVVEIKSKETKCEGLLQDLKNLEKQVEIQKKNVAQISEEILTKVKDNTHLKYSLETKNRIIEDLEKALENSKINHIDTLNEVHKANQSTIEKLNMKLEEMTSIVNEKIKTCEEFIFSNEELKISNINKENEIRTMNEDLDSLSRINEKYLKEKSNLENDNLKLQNDILELNKNLSDIQTNLQEKEKRIQVHILITI